MLQKLPFLTTYFEDLFQGEFQFPEEIRCNEM